MPFSVALHTAKLLHDKQHSREHLPPITSQSKLLNCMRFHRLFDNIDKNWYSFMSCINRFLYYSSLYAYHKTNYSYVIVPSKTNHSQFIIKKKRWMASLGVTWRLTNRGCQPHPPKQTAAKSSRLFSQVAGRPLSVCDFCGARCRLTLFFYDMPHRPSRYLWGGILYVPKETCFSRLKFYNTSSLETNPVL